MSTEINRARLADLLVDPQEDLNCEFKNWLDFQKTHDKAVLAKAALALANHGGGFIVLGFEESDGVLVEAQNRPEALDQYSQDRINGIIQRYCDPHFHCAVNQVENSDNAVFPVITIPGGHRVPVRACRGSPDGKTVQINAIYVRKSGPCSECPNSAQDWDDLLARCLRNRRDELLDHMRDLLDGVVPQASLLEEQGCLEKWSEESFQRWGTLVNQLPNSAEARFAHGHYNFAYEIVGESRQIASAKLPSVLQESEVHHTGWPPFWYPTREEIEPYLKDGAVECWLGRDPRAPPDVAHSDFWRISPNGLAFLLRGYQEDGIDPQEVGRPELEPGTILDVTLPVWRVGEALLHAERLARNLFNGPTTIRFVAEYTGLNGRFLESLDFKRVFRDHQASREESIKLSTHVDAQTIGPNLPEIVHPFLSPLYALFGFFELPMRLVVEELAQMRGRRSSS